MTTASAGSRSNTKVTRQSAQVSVSLRAQCSQSMISSVPGIVSLPSPGWLLGPAALSRPSRAVTSKHGRKLYQRPLTDDRQAALWSAVDHGLDRNESLSRRRGLSTFVSTRTTDCQ